MPILKIKNPYLRLLFGIVWVILLWFIDNNLFKSSNIKVSFLVAGVVITLIPYLLLLITGNLFKYGDFNSEIQDKFKLPKWVIITLSIIGFVAIILPLIIYII